MELPPSTNALYQRRRGGQVTLTKEAHRFREQVKKVVVSKLAAASALPTTPETVYRFTFYAYFKKLENPGWFERFKKGAKKGERKAKTRFKVIDIDNRIKFLQDCVSTYVGIPNDSQIFAGYQEKREDPDNPRVEVTITVVDRSTFFPRRRDHGEDP